ncbi:helix-turn-helix domain-containing protein [Streptomyces sp. NPDC001502]|uniref:helix-turn-helix domain-containing protein n=1 Tax=Streptomyces sp. NPDC001502 TaxID=3364578 RepID=UPI003686FF65
MHKLLVLGDQDDAYAAGNLQRGGKNTAASDHAWAVTRALAAEAVRVGWSRASFLQVLLDGPYEAGQYARMLQHRRGYDRAAAWLQRAWVGAQQYVQNTEPITTRQAFHAALAALRARIERTSWKGIAGKTDLRNLIARMDICAQAGSWDHTVSERDLAERMGCSRTTVHNSNGRLQHARLLRRLDHGSPTEGARWMLISPLSLTASHPRSTPEGPQAGGALSGPAMRQGDTGADIDSHAAARLMRLDAFAHHGLGGSGLTLLAALAERDGQSITELQGSASVSRPTAYRQLNKLKNLGLVEQAGEVYTLAPAALAGIGIRTTASEEPGFDWVEAASRLGTAGVGERRRQRHAAQRAHWRREQARRLQRRRPAGTVAAHPALAQAEHVRADGVAVDPSTGEAIDGLCVGSDGRWIVHHGPAEHGWAAC